MPDVTVRLQMRGTRFETFVNGRRWRCWYNLPLVRPLAWRWVRRRSRSGK